MSQQAIVHRSRPAAITDLCDDLAVEICHEIKRQGLGTKDLQQRLGLTSSRIRDLRRWLAGEELNTGRFYGATAAIRVAEALDIPVRILVGDEARQVSA